MSMDSSPPTSRWSSFARHFCVCCVSDVCHLCRLCVICEPCLHVICVVSQNEREHIAADIKVEFINRLSAVGLQFIEATSFVSPK